MPEREFDLVVYGATGFTGQQAAAYLAAHAPAGLRWTIAGRRAQALGAVASKVGLEAAPIVADSSDPDTLTALAARTRVVLTTAGPYSLYGTPVVQACVAQGAHYVDITGESPWVAQMITAHHDKARADGTRIVPLCGFDSVPSDLGARFMVQQVRRVLGQPTRRVSAFFAMRGGGLNGGTLASGIALAERYPARELADPFLLCPGPTPREVWSAHADPRRPVLDPDRGRWVAPFVMGPVNTRVVRRSAHLLQGTDADYGPDFAYQEYVDVRGGSRMRASLMTAGLGAAASMLGSPIGRRVLRAIGPKPGRGPSDKAMAEGSFKVRYRAEAADGRVLHGELASPGDAGNVSTVRFCAEAALALACDGPALGIGPGSGGVLSPAVALWPVYVDRLRARGVTLRLVDAP